MNLIRSFISLNIDDSYTDWLRHIQNEVKTLLVGHIIKWENPDKFHLTIRFLGDIERGKLKEITEELASISFGFDMIKMVTKGIGFFPNQKRPNVVFIGLEDERNLSEKLVNDLDGKLSKFGFKPDKKFVPHITLGRFRRENRKKLHEQFTMNVEPFEIRFDSFFLMKSVLKPTGSEYEVLHEYKFNNN